MTGNALPKAAGEASLVLSLLFGALAFYVCLAITWFLPDFLGLPFGPFYLLVSVVGAGASTVAGAQVAEYVSPNFNRVGLVVLMATPTALLSIGLIFVASHFPWSIMLPFLADVLGIAIGLGATFHELIKSRSLT